MKSEEQKLLEIFDQLAPEQQDKLIEFAGFLAVRDAGRSDSTAAALEIVPRPAEETVVMAIRRLVKTYPMLDRRRLMAEASRFLAEYALQGRAACEVIDDLETVFATQYGMQKNVMGDK